MRSGPLLLMAAIASVSVRKTRAGPRLAIDAVRIHHAGVDGRALDDRAARARDCRAGNVTVEVRPRRRAPSGIHDHVVGIDAVALAQHAARSARAPFGLLPPVEHRAERFAA